MTDNWTGTWCPQCGPDVSCDEDGCCSACGSTSVGDGCEEALRALAEVERLKAELLREADKHFAGARAVLEDALGEGERVRRPVVCETCDGEGWLHEDPIVDGAVPACPDCGKDGCGPGVRWEP